MSFSVRQNMGPGDNTNEFNDHNLSVTEQENVTNLCQSHLQRCRLCGKEEDSGKLLDIFLDDPGINLDEKISKLLPIVVMPWDPMPHKICPKCIYKLNTFHEFYEETLKAEKFLRTFFPSAPESDAETADPMIRISDHSKDLKPLLKLPPKHVEKPSKPPRSETSETTVEVLDISTDSEQESRHDEKVSEPEADNFLITHITHTDSVYTCRKCHRTYTSQRSAVNHNCRRVEDGENVKVESAEEKFVRPLKIRLFSSVHGIFICQLCQTSFPLKSDMTEHLKEHLLKFGTKKYRRKTRKKKKKRKSEMVEEEYQPCSDSGCNQSEEPLEDNHTSTKILPTDKTEIPNTITCWEDDYDDDDEILEDCEIVNEIPESQKSNGEKPQESDQVSTTQDFSTNIISNMFCCIFCDKIFTCKKHLIAHQNVHLENSSEWSNVGTGKENVQSETGQSWNYVCGICEMTFTQKHILDTHEKFHFLTSM